MKHLFRLFLFMLMAGCLATAASAQGVTTGSMQGLVSNEEGQPVGGASVIAIHIPSGTTYEATTRADGRFSIPGMRVGGPYSVTVTFAGTGGTAFEPQVQDNLMVNLGVSTDLAFVVRPIAVQETITVTAKSDTVFSSNRTGAATALSREEIAALPTVSNRISDFVRLTPQASGNMSFAGVDNRLNNITIDGSYFNNSFGLGGTPGDRTSVAPISPESIEQFQVNVAPFDVRQGNFVGAGVNSITRSGTNQFRGSFYHQFRDDSMVGTEAKDLTVNAGTFEFRNTGGWVSGPVVPNKLFFFFNVEDELLTQPGTTFRANLGGETVGGGTTRVLASDLDRISRLMAGAPFNYETGPYQDYDHETPATRYLFRADYNLNNANKVTFRYIYLDSFTDVLLSNSSSLGFGTRRTNTTGLNYQNSNYQILENIRSGVGEWNSILRNTMANSLIVGYTTNDESRASRGSFFPFIDILSGSSVYTSLGFEPFTPNNELRYKTFQLQDNFTKYGRNHTFTFGASYEYYESENVFFPGAQSVYVYNSLADFEADMAGYIANPNRTTSPVTLNRFQVRWNNIPGQEKPIQPLEVNYWGAYAQDEWAVRDNVKIVAGLRFDVPVFGDTAYTNANADALTFREEDGNPIQYQTGKLPDPNVLWSPRAGFNWDVSGNATTQVRGGTGIFTGKPAYVWISNQIGNTGVLTGFLDSRGNNLYPFHPDPNHYKPASVDGSPASSYELALTDADFRFPQVWRSNIAVDQRLPGGFTGTLEYLYNHDVNGVYYINANLPAAQTTFVGADNRPRWTSNRIHANVSNATVIKNQDVGKSWNLAASLSKTYRQGFFRTAYSYGENKNTVDPGSIAYGSWTANQISGDPNNPGLGYSPTSPGHRFFVTGSYRLEYFNFGATTVSAFWESRTIGNASYTFSGDLNNDGGSSNDLLYIHRDISEMNFQTFTSGGVTYTADQQAQAWNAYIDQDPYLSERRGQYAERGALFLPLVHRIDLSVAQDVFFNVGSTKQRFQIRLDMLNFGNLLNSDWGVAQRLINAQPLTISGSPVDAQGRATYRMRVVNNQLMNKSYEQTADTSDVYRFLISLKYFFN